MDHCVTPLGPSDSLATRRQVTHMHALRSAACQGALDDDYSISKNAWVCGMSEMSRGSYHDTLFREVIEMT